MQEITPEAMQQFAAARAAQRAADAERAAHGELPYWRTRQAQAAYRASRAAQQAAHAELRAAHDAVHGEGAWDDQNARRDQEWADECERDRNDRLAAWLCEEGLPQYAGSIPDLYRNRVH